MEVKALSPQSLNAIIRARRSIRSFTDAVPHPDVMKEVLEAAIFAPYGRAADLPPQEIRKIFVFSRDTAAMNHARELLQREIRRLACKVRIATLVFPFLKKRMGLFAKRIERAAENGIQGLSVAPFYIVVAVKKGFPAMEKQTIAHAMQNMWLTATAHGLGFQLISLTGILAKHKEFMDILGLVPGDYELDGCLIGIPKQGAEPRDELLLEDFVIWVG